MSDSEIEDESNSDNDTLGKIDVMADDADWEDETEDKSLLDEISELFSSKEAVGENVNADLAKILERSLRAKPIASKIKDLCGKIKVPKNIKNFKIPETNEDIVKAMTLKVKYLDNNLQRLGTLLMKSLSPIVYFISDSLDSKPIDKKYVKEFNNSLRLITAALNYTFQLRKDVIRINIQDQALADLCKKA